MKKGIILSAMLLVAGFLFAQQPVITFEKVEHDFGKINEADGRVSTVFEFKNEGMEPLVLSNVRASCGCTTPTWTKTPIEPGQTGAITVTYNPNGRPGRFQKTITVTSNATEATKKLYIKGEVIPKSAQPVNKYPVKMGDLSLSANSINFGTVLKGKTLTKSIEYANLTDGEITVTTVWGESTPIQAVATLEKVAKGQSGQIKVLFDAEVCKAYGPMDYDLYIVVNGKKVISDEYKVKLSVNVEEDFSQMTPEQLLTAPIFECPKSINLGVITPGKKVKKTLTIGNAGVDQLYVRRIIHNSESLFKVVVGKGALKSGKKSTIAIEIDGKENGHDLKAGEYSRLFHIITNDPKNPKQKVVVTWTVQ